MVDTVNRWKGGPKNGDQKEKREGKETIKRDYLTARVISLEKKKGKKYNMKKTRPHHQRKNAKQKAADRSRSKKGRSKSSHRVAAPRNALRHRGKGPKRLA